MTSKIEQLTSVDFDGFIDPFVWLNNRMKTVSLEDLDGHLYRLNLSLSLYSQDLTDNNDVLSAKYLSLMTGLQKDVEKMAAESEAAAKRFAEISSTRNFLEQQFETKNPKEVLDSITEAKDKIIVVKQALKKRSSRIVNPKP